MEKHLQIIGRADAKRLGMKRYFTGKPCKHGHVEERFVSARKCAACAYEWNAKTWKQYENKEYKKEYSKKHYRENIEKAKEKRKDYYERNKDEAIKRARNWKKENRDKVKFSAKKAYWKNPKESREKLKQKRIRNHDRIKYLAKVWREKNPERAKLNDRTSVLNRIARKKAAQGHHTADDIKRLLTEQRHHCAACNADLNKTGYHVDHIQPLARGGTNWLDNLQILCPPCNLSKGAKDPVEWAQSRGKLL